MKVGESEKRNIPCIVYYYFNLLFHTKQEAARLDNWETAYIAASSENSPKTVVPVITGHGIFKVQCTLHNVWGKVALIRLCIPILFLNKKLKRLENSQLLRKT